MNHIYQTRKGNKGLKLLSLFLFFFTGLYAQDKQGEVTLIKATQFAISRPLRDIAKENPVDENYIHEKKESPDKEHRKPQLFPLANNNDPVYGNDLSVMQREPGTVEGGQTRLNVDGQTPGGGFRPYDPSGAVGPNHYIQMINSTTFRIYNKATGAVLATTTLGSLWTPATANAGDPIVMYDKAADRWFLSQFGAGNQVYIAVSTSPNPLGTYFTYTYISPLFPDYLKFGVWHDAYYMTSNQNPTRVFAFNRSEILAGTVGARSISQTYSPPKPGGFWLPIAGDAADGVLPPAGTPCPIMSFEDNGWGAGFADEMNIYNMAVNWVPAVPTSTITATPALPLAAFNAAYNPSWNDVSQPGTAQKLDGIGGVCMYRAQWKTWPTYNSVLLNWGVEISGTQRSIKWVELRQNKVSGVWSVYQEGIYTPDANTRWMGSICMDNNGSIGLSYMKSNSTTIFPGLYYTGRRTCDPLGTLPVAEQLVVAGTGSQTGTNRVGDYAQTTLDMDGLTFWSTSEYMGGPTGGTAARTRIFSYQIAPCSVPVAVSIALTSGTNPTCSGQLVTFTATPTNGGTLPVYQWKVNGANVWFNSPTFTTSSLVSGQTVTCELTSNAPGAIGNPATSNAIIMTVNPIPSIGAGSVTANPNPICQGAPLTLTYNAPACATANGFAGYFAPANWALTQTNSNGSVGTTLAPASISMVSSNGLSGLGTTDYAITIQCAGNVTFNWSYTTLDGAQYDYPQYVINSGTPVIFPGYSTASGTTPQSGTVTIAVNAGDVLHLQAVSTDNFGGSCTTVISNFTAPYTPSISTVWYDAPTAGGLYAFGSPATLNLNAGTYQFFAELTDNLSGCSPSNRIATNPIIINPFPQAGSANAVSNYFCLGTSVTGTYTLPCVTIANFSGDYAVANWTQALINSNGSVNTGSAPASILLISSDNTTGNPGFTNYSVTVPCGGTITFNWNYTTLDGSFWDRPRYSLNGNAFLEFSTYNTGGSTPQSGTQTIAVAAGQTLTLQAYSVDNGGGACTITISNFNFSPAQNINWFSTPTGGTNLGTTNPITTTPPVAGTYAYYAELSDPNTGCINPERVASNFFVVNSIPALGTASASPTPLCIGSPLTLTYAPTTCEQNIAFQGNYQPSNWTTLNTNSNGSVNTTNAPASISLISSDGLSGSGTTDYTINILCSGTLSFNWKYTTTDGSYYDRPRYSINGAPFTEFPGYQNFGGQTQYGTESFAVTAGQTFSFQAWSVDNFAGACTIAISNFKAPGITNHAPAWYTVPSAGGSIASYSPATYITNTAGPQTFYAEVYDLVSFCFNSTRVATNNVQVNALPSVGISPATVTICEGQSATLTGTGATTYTWMPGSLTGTSVTVSAASTTIYTVTGTNANGCVNTATRLVIVNPTPTLGIANVSPSSICLGASANLSYTTPAVPACNGANQSGFAATYAPANWATSNLNSNGTVNTGSAPASISMTSSDGLVGSGSTNYTITVPCTGMVSFNWSYTTPDGAAYDQPRYSINGASAVNFPGFNSSLGTAPQSGTANILVQAGQTFSFQAYSVDNVSGACTFVISNFVAPTQTVSNHSVVWYNVPSGGGSLGSGNPQSTTPTVSGGQTFYAQVTQTTTGCTNTTRVASNLLNVIALPNTLASATSTSICQGNSTTLIGSNATSYTWMPGALTGASVTVSPASTTTYTVTGTGTGGCTKTATITITVNPIPPVGTTVTNATICSGNSTSITGTGAATYTWQPGALTGTTINVSPVANTIYTVTGTSALGCVGTATRLITVNLTPSVGTSITNATICAGSSTSITGTGASTYSWQPGALTGTTITVAPAVTTTYTVTGTAANGCTQTATRLVTVNSLPVNTTVTNATICSGNSTSITATGAATYSWQPGALTGTTITVSPSTTTTYTVTGTGANGCIQTATRLITVNLTPTVGTSITASTICAGSSTSITGTGASTYTWQPGALTGTTISVSPASTTTYTVTGTAANGCTQTATRLVTVNAQPSVNTTVTNATICAGSSTSITGTGASTYSWQPGALTGTTITVSPASTTTYTVTGTGANGCTQTATRTITVNTLPGVGTTASATSICVGSSTTLTGTGATTYTWMPGSLSGTSVTVSPASTTTYTVTGTNTATGCTNTSTRTITVTPCSNSTLTVKFYIQGYYLAAGFMKPVLANEGIGSSTVDVDNVTVELRNSTFPYSVAHTFTGMLKTNGNVVCTFPSSVNGNSYYIAVKHRNAVQTWSANPVLMASSVTYDFSNLKTKAYGDNQSPMNIANTIWGFFSGDINQDENVDLGDNALLEASVLAFDFGYIATDIDGDGNVDLGDVPILSNNINDFIFSNHP